MIGIQQQLFVDFPCVLFEELWSASTRQFRWFEDRQTSILDLIHGTKPQVHAVYPPNVRELLSRRLKGRHRRNQRRVQCSSVTNSSMSSSG